MQGKDHVDRKERQTNSLGTNAVMSDAQIHFIKIFYMRISLLWRLLDFGQYDICLLYVAKVCTT